MLLQELAAQSHTWETDGGGQTSLSVQVLHTQAMRWSTAHSERSLHATSFSMYLGIISYSILRCIKDWVTHKIIRFGNIFNMCVCSYQQPYQAEFRVILKCHETTKGRANLSPTHHFVDGIWRVLVADLFRTKM